MARGHDERWERTRWFREARFGMFVHFGLYSMVGRGEWVQSHERIPHAVYRERYFDLFTADWCDMGEWARSARLGGMRYAVLTAKHHDGFCLFDSAHTDFTSPRSPAGRDLVAEFCAACREEGLRVGLYYSLPDWAHPGYPAWGDRQHPQRDDPAERGRERDIESYLDYMHAQVRELCTNYGTIDLLWFDFSYHDMRGEAWRATDLVRMVRELQPEILIDNRLGGALISAEPPEYAGDFAGPEHLVPQKPISAADGSPVAWETCVTLNNSWSHTPDDTAFKDDRHLIHALVNCTSKDGNLLVNMSPDGRGAVPAVWHDTMEEIGSWLAINGRSIYGCGSAHSVVPQPEWGRYTTDGTTLYAHILHPGIGHYHLAGLRGHVLGASRLQDGVIAPVGPFWNSDAGAETFDGENDLYFNVMEPFHATIPLPDGRDTVIAIHLRR